MVAVVMKRPLELCTNDGVPLVLAQRLPVQDHQLETYICRAITTRATRRESPKTAESRVLGRVLESAELR